ncbi:MAG TPA: pitrilysin family protein [Steroidobacteraceae bacterium]|nr:pitrilysin family protein [Steroidobacteraceae bacterium]
MVAATVLAAGGASAIPVARAAAAIAAPAAAAPRVDVPVPANERVTLPNGLRLILVPRHGIPLVACNLLLRGGALLDPPGRDGTAALAADLLTHGAGARDAYAFADAVEGAGGNLDAAAHAEYIQVQGQFLARDSRLMLELLADAVLRPRFDAEEFDKLRERRIEEIKAAKDSQPEALLGNYGRALLFAGHPYGDAVGGSEAALARLTRADVARYYAAQSGADRAILVIAGDFDPARVRADVEAVFGGWRRAAAPLPPLPASARVHGRRLLLVDSPGSAQTYIWMANVGVPRHYALRPALNIANLALGGSFGSLLNRELRVKAGLTYDASSRFTRGLVAGEFAISTFTQTDKSAQALQLALDTLAGFKHDGLDAAATDAARNYLLGQYPLAFETPFDWAVALGDLDFYGLPESYIGHFGSDLVATDAAAIHQVIDDAFPSPADLDIVLIGDAAKIRDSLSAFGPVTTMPLSAPEFAPAPADR